MHYYEVRVDKDGNGYVFKVQPSANPLVGLADMVSLDSTPGIIALVQANSPAHACERAWFLAEHMHDDKPDPLSPAARAALDAGLASAARGEIISLGSFAQFIEDDEDEI
jgi:hypothetical protein